MKSDFPNDSHGMRYHLNTLEPLWEDTPIRDCVHVLPSSERERLELEAFAQYKRHMYCQSDTFEKQVRDALHAQKGNEETIRAALEQEQYFVDYSEEFYFRKSRFLPRKTRNAQESYAMHAYRLLATYQETAPIALDFWQKLMSLNASVERNTKAADWTVKNGERYLKTLHCLSEDKLSRLEYDAFNRYARKATGLPDDFMTMAHFVQEMDGGDVGEIHTTLKNSIMEADFTRTYAIEQERFRPEHTESMQENDIICCLRFLTRFQQTALKALEVWSEMLFQMAKLIGVQGGVKPYEE